MEDATTDTGSPWGLQVSVVVQNNQELKAPSLTCGALTAAGCNAPWEAEILTGGLKEKVGPRFAPR